MGYTAKQVDAQGNIDFSVEEHETWRILLERQRLVIHERGCEEFIAGVEKLNFSSAQIPTLASVSNELACTGWQVAPVSAIIPLKDFFALIAARKFPVATFIRCREELDYLKEPDIFHEYFGHCPLLTYPAYADFVAWYGKFALTVPQQWLPILGRLFWFTIEFGLINTADGLRIMGGGILSSFAETQFCLVSNKPQRIPFDLITLLNTDYNYWEIQQRYFVLRDFDQLYELQDEAKLREAIESVTVTNATAFRTC